MPGRPEPDVESTVDGVTEQSTSSTAAGSSSAGPTADLDEREERQSPQRKAAGPGGAAQPAAMELADLDSDDAAAGADVLSDEGYKFSWGTDPCAMPPATPEGPAPS